MKLKHIVFGLLMLIGCNCGGGMGERVGEDHLQVKIDYYQDKDHIRNYNKHVSDRTVSIRKDCEPKDPDYEMLSDDLDARGTGVVLRSYKEVSYIVTAAHILAKGVSDPNDVIICNFSVGIEKTKYGTITSHPMKAHVVFSDEKRDAAIIKVYEDLGVNTDFDLDPILGDPVTAVGFGSLKADSGIIKLSISRGELASIFVDGGSEGYYHRVTSQIYFGNSGGGVWSADRKLLGVVISLYQSGGAPIEGQYYIKTSADLVKLIKDHRLGFLLDNANN